MIIVGELINASRKEIAGAIESRDKDAIQKIAKGLDGAIVDPLDRTMVANIIIAETLAGRDEFCVNYINAFRSGRFIHRSFFGC
jgi:hypothetical protein